MSRFLSTFMIVAMLASTIATASECQAQTLFAPPTESPQGGAQNQQTGQNSPLFIPSPTSPDLQCADLTRQTATLPEIEQIAIAANPTLAKAGAEIEAARGRWTQAGLYPNPTIGYAADEMGEEGTAGQQGGFVQQEIVTAGKLHLRRDRAAREIQQAEQRFAAQQFRVLTDVRAAYYEVLIAHERIRVTQRIAEISEQSSTTVQRLIEARQATRVESLEADVEQETSRLAVRRAENELVTAMRRLAALAGKPELESARIEGELGPPPPPANWENQLSEIRQMSPERASAISAVERARVSLRQAVAERVPNVDVSTTVQKDNSSGYTIAGLQVGVPLPIFNRNQGAIHEAEANITVSERDVNRFDLDLQQRLAPVYQRLTDSHRELARYHEVILPKSDESLRLVTAGYSAGELSYLNLLTAQRTYFRTSLQYLDLLHEAWKAHVEIKGLLLSGNLFQAQSGETGSAEK